MREAFILLISLVFVVNQSEAQKQGKEKIDSLLSVLKTLKPDTAKVNTLDRLASEFLHNNPDTAISFANKARTLAIRLNYKMGIANAFLTIGGAFSNLGNYEKALKNNNDALSIYNQLLLVPIADGTNGTKNTGYKQKVLNKKATAYSNIGEIFYHQDNYPEALKNYSAALKIYEGTRNKKGISSYYNNIGLIYTNQGNYPEGLKNFFASLKINKEIGDKNGIGSSYANIGSIYYHQGNYPEALKNNFTALKIDKESGDKHGIASDYLSIGTIYYEQGNYPEALKSFSASLNICEETGDKNLIARLYVSIGNVYDAQGNHPEALKEFFAALKIDEEIGAKIGIAGCYNNIAVIYQTQGNYPEALKKYKAASMLFEETGNKDGLATSLNNIANIYAKQKKYDQASQFHAKGLALAKQIGNLRVIEKSYGDLVYLDRVQGNFKQAFEHAIMYFTYRDSIENKETAKKIMQIQMQYEFDNKEALAKAEQEKKDALAMKELQNQKTRQHEYFIIGGALLLLIVIGLIIYFRSKRSRDKEQLTTIFRKQLEQAETKALRAQMNPHFIFNSLNSINSFVMEQKHEIASDYLIKFSKLIRLILDNSRSETISIEKELETLKLYVVLESARFDNKFKCVYHIADNVNTNSVMIPPMLLQPFVENAIWHGLMQKEGEGTITVEIKKENEDFLNISITDDGIGREKAAELKSKSATHKSHGLKVTSQRIEMMNKLNSTGAQVHVIDLKNGQGHAMGTRVELIIPV